MRLTTPGKPEKHRRSKTGDAAAPQRALKNPLPTYTKYRAEYAQVAREACANLGADIASLAAMFGVTSPTIHNWMNGFPDFYDAVHKGRDRFDAEHVESALLRCATGYDKEVSEERLTKDGQRIRCHRTIHVPPNVQAAEFWLINRNRERWQSTASKFQQLNVYPPSAQAQLPSGGNGKGNGDAKLYEAELLRDVANILNDAGAFEALPGAVDGPGADPKAN
jgi:hypothetical protein